MSIDRKEKHTDIGNCDVYLGREKRKIGLLRDVSLNAEIESKTLEHGFPSKVIDSRKISEKMTVKSTSSEISPYNLALLLGTKLIPVNEGTDNVTDEQLVFKDLNKTLYLLNKEVSSVVIKNAPSTQQIQEDFAYGNLGAVSGEFKLIWPIDNIADVSSVTVNGEIYTVKAVGSAAVESGVKSVEIVTTAGATNGNLQFFVGNGTSADAVDIEGALRIIFTPAPASLVEDTDYKVDEYNGGLIPKPAGGIDVDSTYFISYTYKTYEAFKIPFGGSTEESPEHELLLVHKKKGGKKREFQFFRAKIKNTFDYQLKESDFHELPIEFEILADETRPEGEQMLEITDYV